MIGRRKPVTVLQRLGCLPWHPFIVAFVSVGVVYVENLSELEVRWLVVPMLVALSTAGLLLLIASLIFDGIERASLATTAGLLAFCCYGYVFSAGQWVVARLPGIVGVNRYLLPLWVCGIAWALVSVYRMRAPGPASRRANVVALSALIILLANWAVGGRAMRTEGSLPPIVPLAVDSATAPDILYVILDGYARADVLHDYFDFDNAVFLKAVADSGMHVIADSRSNYSQTPLSLASSLNGEYLSSLPVPRDRRSTNRRPLLQMIERNRIVRSLRHSGYRFGLVSSGWLPTSNSILADTLYRASGLWMKNEFTVKLLSTTIGNIFVQGYATVNMLSSQREIDNAFKALRDLHSEPAPQFVFAHILAPHPPYVVTADGGMPASSLNAGNAWANKAGYVGEVEYLNHRVLELLAAIRARSGRRVILILQSDHGPYSAQHADRSSTQFNRERTSNFLAFYWPGRRGKEWPRSPVNIFRLLFSEEFGATLPMLADHSYFSPWYLPYAFEEVIH